MKYDCNRNGYKHRDHIPDNEMVPAWRIQQEYLFYFCCRHEYLYVWKPQDVFLHHSIALLLKQAFF